MTYLRRASPLHAARGAVASLWCVVLAVVALSFEHPLVLLALLATIVAAAAAARVGRRVLLMLAISLPFALVIGLVNPLVVRDGLTVIARLGTVPVLGQLDITAEATAYGGVLALRALVIVGCFALHSAAVDPDELLRAFRRISFRSALTAALATRMVPVLGRDARRLHDAQRCLAGEPAPRRAIVRAVAAGALDRAVDVAATLEVRGYGAARRAPRGGGRPWSRHDLAFTRERDRAGGRRARRARRRRAGLLRLPDVQRAGRRRRSSGSAPSSPRARCCRSPTAGGSADERAAARPRQLPLPGRGARRRCATSTSTSPPASSSSWPARAARASRRCCAPPAGSSRTSTAASSAAGSRSAGWTRARTTRRRSPRSPARCSRTPRPRSSWGRSAPSWRSRSRTAAWRRPRSRAGWRRRRSRSGIAGLLDRSTHELSGGELQRVALGAALAGRPRVALLDEPTSQLDPVAGDELLGVLRRINEEWGTAVVLAEHRLERCLGAADRVVALRDGAIACDADPRGFLDWAGEHAPELQTPGARLFALAGRTPPPVSVKDARRALGGFEAPRARGARAAAPPAPARPPRGRARRSRTSGSSTRAARRCCAASTWRSRPASASR